MFQIGAQCGLKPNEVLDMSLDVFRAVVRGYNDHIFDLQLLAVQQGYWSGYYNRAKKPKSLEAVLKKMFKTKSKDTQKKSQSEITEEDIETFLQREQLRLSRINK